MRMYEDMKCIVPKKSYKEARELVRQCKEHPNSTCCVVIAGYRAKTKDFYIELQKEYYIRHGHLFDVKDYPWIVGWKYGCGHHWKDNT